MKTVYWFYGYAGDGKTTQLWNFALRTGLKETSVVIDNNYYVTGHFQKHENISKITALASIRVEKELIPKIKALNEYENYYVEMFSCEEAQSFRERFHETESFNLKSVLVIDILRLVHIIEQKAIEKLDADIIIITKADLLDTKDLLISVIRSHLRERSITAQIYLSVGSALQADGLHEMIL